MKKAAVGAQGEFFWTEPPQSARTWEAIVVNNLPVMFHGQLGLKLVGSVMIEAEVRSCAIGKCIHEVSTKIDPIQDVGWGGKSAGESVIKTFCPQRFTCT